MLANNIDEYLAVERMANIRREVAEARLQSSFRTSPADAQRPSAQDPRKIEAKVAEISDEAFRNAA